MSEDFFGADSVQPHEELVLRPLQAAALEKVRQAWRDKHVNVLLQAPCGFGKTETATAMLQAATAKPGGDPCLFLCDRLSLLQQTSQRFDKYGLQHGIYQGDNDRWQPWRKVQICSVQTLRVRTWPEAALYVVDEAHMLTADVKRRIIDRKVRCVGLTATPFTRGLGKYFDVVVNAATTRDLIRAGLLCDYRIFAPSEPDMTGVKVKPDGEYEEVEAESRVLPIVGDCVREYLARGDGKKFIAFAVSVAHAEELRRQFQGCGIPAALYTYCQTDSQREAAVAEFRKPDSYIRGLISIESLTRGFDVADVGVLILARPLRKSLSQHIQMIGRVLRTAEGKSEAVILDHSANCVRFYAETEHFFDHGVEALDDGRPKEQSSRKLLDREPMKCPRCTSVHARAPMCPHCGHEYPRQAATVHRPGELSEIGGGRLAGQGEDRQHVYSQLLTIARMRGWKPGAAANYFRERFGEYPNGLADVEATPTTKIENWVRSRLIAFSRAGKRSKPKRERVSR